MKPDDWIDDMVGVFTDPIIVMAGGWGETLPDWIKGEIKMQRLLDLAKRQKEGDKDPMASDAEACAYLYTASLTAPLGSDWTRIYLYIATKVMNQHGTEAPDDIKVDSLSDHQMSQLRDLKRWIYRQRVKARQDRRRVEKRKAQAAAEDEAPEQPKLF